ncbi:flavin monoamine oxidase family protein [Pseudoduganella sp. HUAS MS19]
MKVKRRTILKAGACFGSLLGAGIVGAADHHAGQRKVARRAIVVGAGIAGLAAAKRLRQAGMDVIVLEARDRIGGRIHTFNNWSGPAIDLGASWIHGAGSRNPIATMARQIGARMMSTSLENAETFSGEGSVLNEADNRKLESLRSAIEEAIAEQDRSERDGSLRSFVYSELNYQERSEYDKRMIDFLLNSTYEHEYGAAANKLSRLWFDSGSSFDGEEMLLLDGYKVITDHLAHGIDIKLKHQVKSVAYHDSGVSLDTSHGAFQADYAVITLPLGVLQSGSVRFFPSLPERKQNAIDRLGMGILNKCVLLFPHAFWDRSIDWLNQIPRPGRAGEWAEWVSLLRPTGRPVLMGFNAAESGTSMEQWSNARIIQSAMDNLRHMFGRDIPAPVDAAITRWASDPFSRGAYSCHIIGSTPSHRDDLASSVNHRLYFAGEATSKKHYQTVHGAYESGLRAAEEAIRTG